MKLLENAPTFNDNYEPLEIRVELCTPPVFYQTPTLDAILAWSVVHEATQGAGLPETPDPYFIPLPLAKLWTCEKTLLPLWDATQFVPIGENTQQSAYWHKRGYKPDLLKKGKTGRPHNANFGNGRHKEYRMPLPLQTSLFWKSYCRGNVADIMNLLSRVTSLSKKRTQGYGKVLKWSVEQIDEIPYWKDSRLIKAFPVESDKPEFPSDVVFDIYETGWTPPYWLATTYRRCAV